MKILHIIVGLNNGGAESVLARLTKADKEHSHHIIALMDEGSWGAHLKQAGIPVHTLDMPRGRVTSRGLLKLHRLVRQIRPDVVQTWMYHADLLGGLAAMLAGRPPVVWGIRSADLSAFETSTVTRLVARICGRLSKVLPEQIVSCSQGAVEVHEALGYPREKLVVIQNGYDFSRLAPDTQSRKSLRDKWGVAPNEIVLGMVAHWQAQKDHGNLLGALAACKSLGNARPWRCVLVGRQMDKSNDALSRLIEQHNLQEHIHLLGSRDDVPAIMNALDLHILSSAGEGFPNVVAEAMACGTPCIVTDVGDAALIVDSNGWVAPPADAGKLSDCIVEALEELDDAQAWSKRQEASRQWVMQEFSLEGMVDAYHRVWESVRAKEALCSVASRVKTN